MKRFIFSLFTLICLGTSPLHVQALTLLEKPSKPDDLIVSGNFVGVPSGQKRYIAHDELVKLAKGRPLTEQPAPGVGVHKLTVLPLADLIQALPFTGSADCVLAHCADTWESEFSLDFIQTWKPYLLLLIDGKSTKGMNAFHNEALYPYFINVSDTWSPTWKNQKELTNKDPTQVVELVAVNRADYIAPLFAGKFANLDAIAEAGRTIFINNCLACHQGPGGHPGGNVSQKPWEVIAAQAVYNTDYFKKWVRNPQSFKPGTVMPEHEHFTEDTFTKLIAFFSKGMKSS
jgi:cytochrome c2